jgi:hypothetical protein
MYEIRMGLTQRLFSLPAFAVTLLDAADTDVVHAPRLRTGMLRQRFLETTGYPTTGEEPDAPECKKDSGRRATQKE